MVCVEVEEIFAASDVDILHLPDVERAQFGTLPLGAKRNPDAVGAVGIDPGGDALSVVGEDFDDALVDEDPQFERFVSG
jgi:hypothetical protein